jgi:hypothetical protein
MSGRNIDFLAVCLIAIAMLGFSKAASLKLPTPMDSFQFESVGNVVDNVDACPLNEALSRIAYILNQ